MADMTLEKADKILAKYRSHGSYRGKTDFAIIRELHRTCTIWKFSALFTGAMNLQRTTSTEGSPVFGLSLSLISVGVAIYAHFIGKRYSEILELFEAAAPQNLEDLKTLSLPSSHPTHETPSLDRTTDW